MHIIYVGTTYVKSLIFGTLIPKSHNQIWERQIRNKAVTTLIFLSNKLCCSNLRITQVGNLISKSDVNVRIAWYCNERC